MLGVFDEAQLVARIIPTKASESKIILTAFFIFIYSSGRFIQTLNKK